MNSSNPPPSHTSTTEPLRIGHYELRNCIGRGGMGLVYRARDTKLEREVAVKCLRTELFEAHYVERFKREALLLAKLNHPNIVQIYDYIEAHDQLALVMELVDGQNLQTYLREHIAPIAQRLQWLAQIAEGLAAAHDTGIIHRDLKTENILINKRGQAKITDLGIAKSQDFKGTLTDHIAGSYCSMSPEQAMGEAITFKSDLFSLGILAYQLLCGAHPFGDTNNKLQTMQRIISHPPTAPHKYNPDLPAELIELLGQLLSKDPDKRPDNTHWVAAQFEKLKTLRWQETALGDETQALIAPSANTRSSHTQDHPTFETRFAASPTIPKVSAWQKIKQFIAANIITVSSAAISMLIVAGVMAWQLQPKPPKYVAVIPPKMIAEGMQESQQELVKEAVYDAIQQSIIQLDGYYLIPREEVVDVNGDNETVRNATAADELITTELQCKIETCTIRLSRLTPENSIPNSRLKAHDTKTIDILTENYLSIAGIVQSNVGGMYKSSLSSSFEQLNQGEYEKLLSVNVSYYEKGASEALFNSIETLSKNTQKLSTTQSLFSEIGLDLYHETQSSDILSKIELLLDKGNTKNDHIIFLYNTFYLQTAQRNFLEAQETISKIKAIDANQSSINALTAYLMNAQNKFDAAITLYKKAVSSKNSVKNLIGLSNSYRYAGNMLNAKETLKQAMLMAPKNYKVHSLYGLIELLEGNIESAKKAFEVAVNENPNDIYNRGNLGLCYLLSQNFDKAIEEFSQAEKLDPQNTAHKLNKADAYNLKGEIAESQVIYSSIISTLEKNAYLSEHHLRLAQAYAHIGQIEKALLSLRELEKLDPQNIETAYTAALVHTLANNDSSAILNISISLKNGMHPAWFSFSWFDSLCKKESFIHLINSTGASNRCPESLR
ncbi:serine/threonine-protein kinase [Cellvibrio sp. pealriver]|uniref:serine/threonine-protein kinase n=1 Tax=Cellvibrio sp. pealriver TaxID=1622269 RepID=UPI00066FCF4D|nr:serine/threonine-protein kinase [Cellvibrio sp. pealriver]